MVHRRTALLFVVTLLSTIAVCASGQTVTGYSADDPEPRLQNEQAQRADEPYQPPTISAPRIELLEAIRLALQHDPNIRLQEETSDIFLGLFQQETGRFDVSLLGGFNYQFVQDELSKEQIKSETEKRSETRRDLDEMIETRARAQQLQRELQTVLANPNAPPNVQTDRRVQLQLEVINQLIAQNQGNPDVVQNLQEMRTSLLTEGINELTDEIRRLNTDIGEATTKLQKLGTVPTRQQQMTFAPSGVPTLQLQMPTRTGITIAPFLDINVTGSTFVGKSKEAELGGTGSIDTYRSGLGIAAEVPLGRGAGWESATAFERSARVEFQASRASLRHASDTTVLSTAQAYWELVAAQQRVSIFELSLGLQGRMVSVTRTLIQGDELPAAELPRAQASEANIQVTLFGARRSLHEARVNLARTIGLNVEDVANAPLAADDFPTPPPAGELEQIDDQDLIATALDNRDDITASRHRQRAGSILMRAAELDLRPQFNTSFQARYSGLGEDPNIGQGITGALFDEWVGPSASVGLSVDWPIRNNTFRGRLVQQEAQFRQREIGSANLSRIIKANVVQTLASLREAAAAVRNSEQAVSLYAELIENEIEKLRAGQSTLVDTILTEQRLTDARLSAISARQQYAMLLAQLRFETGTLTQQDRDSTVVTRANLMSLPTIFEGDAQ